MADFLFSSGAKKIKETLNTIPELPGVYRMLDDKQKVLYVGKAKNLYKRISSYVNMSRLSNRIIIMVGQTRSLEIIVTKTETEALLMEANLIKSLKPKFNILLKDDKSFPYILVKESHKFGQILKYRGNKDIKGKYFGPFASVRDVDNSIEYLQKTFKIRSCSDNYFSARVRPCMQYQIKRCSAPCTNKIDQEEYGKSLHQACEFLRGNNKTLLKDLAIDMDKASKSLQYEKAAEFRDRIKSLNNIQSKQILGGSIQSADIIAVHKEQNFASIQIFLFRNGQNYGNKSFFPDQTEGYTEDDIISAFISHFYQYNQPPEEVFLSHELDDKKILEESFNIKISTPQKGKKKELIEFVLDNAKKSLKRHLSEKYRNLDLLGKVQDLFELPKIPSRIEVYDNSHISGQHAVGAMIVARTEGFCKKDYRLFNIKTTNTSDDYQMLKEVLSRRLKRLNEDNYPDLLLIDGGAGHLSTALEVKKQMKIDIPIVCISKGPMRNAGREQFHMPGKPSFTLDKDDDVMRYLQILRDEAHRFAITNHRKKRTKKISDSKLDEIPGIGPKRKKILLNHFGSIQAIEDSSIKELSKADSINKETAKMIYEFFHRA